MDEVATEGAAVELGSALWQKIFVAPIVLLFCGCGVVSAVGALCPQLLEHRPDKLPSVGERVLFLFGGPFMFGMGAYMSQLWFYRLRADAYGLTERLGWKETRVFWSDVHSYTMEFPRDYQSHAQPVFRDAQGAVLFRPAMNVPGLVPDEAARGRFWSFMDARLPGKQMPYLPPALPPSIYEGKSARWMVKRAALTLACILAFLGLWSGAMLWAIAQPALPRWAWLTINFAVFWVPYLVGLALARATKRR